MDWMGQKLGNYQIIRALGHGGFADVYLGQHTYLKTYAAIKVLQTRLASNDLQTFLREAQTVASLTHPHIVRVLEFGEEGHTPYLVMGYCPNGTLRQRHPKGTRVSLPECVAYVKQMAEALQYAHDRKIIHRDVKPENMLIGQNDTLLLSDFGIAIVSQSSRYQSYQDIGGTIAYSAPEQLQGKASSASDQYALGIVLYEWLTGELPYQGSFAEIASQHLVAPVPTIRDKVPSLPLAVEQVLQKALAKEPQQRFQRVRDFAAALELAADGELAPTVIQPEQTDGQANIPTYIKTQFAPSREPSISQPLPTPTHFVSRQTPPLSASSFPTPAYQPIQGSPRKKKISLSIVVILLLLLALGAVSARAFLFPPASSTQRGGTPSQASSNGQTSISPTAVPTVTPGTMTVNKRLTCGGCDDPLVITINTITFDPAKQQMTWNITLNNASGDTLYFRVDQFDLQDPSNVNNTYEGTGNLRNYYTEPGAGTGTGSYSDPVPSGQSIQVEAIFSFNPLRGEPYQLTAHGFWYTPTNVTNRNITFDPIQFTF